MNPVFFTDRDLGNQFPAILHDAGVFVEVHRDHFSPTTPDAEWLPVVAEQGWFVLTHDRRIRYKPNQTAAVMNHGCGLFILVGSAPFPALARNFVATKNRVTAFLEKQERPFIAKIYRPSHCPVEDMGKRPGRVELWLDYQQWAEK